MLHIVLMSMRVRKRYIFYRPRLKKGDPVAKNIQVRSYSSFSTFLQRRAASAQLHQLAGPQEETV